MHITRSSPPRARDWKKAFCKGLRDYLRKNAGETVTSINLENPMAAASDQDLRATFKK
jgi:aminopeptidase N